MHPGPYESFTCHIYARPVSALRFSEAGEVLMDSLVRALNAVDSSQVSAAMQAILLQHLRPGQRVPCGVLLCLGHGGTSARPAGATGAQSRQRGICCPG